MITFTKSEEKKLLKNRDMITEYISRMIIPHMYPGDVFEVNFGDRYTSPRSFNVTTEYHLKVYKNEHTFNGWHSSGNGHIGFGERFGGCRELFETEDSVDNIYTVIKYWDDIKRSLLIQVKENKDNHNEINEFNAYGIDELDDEFENSSEEMARKMLDYMKDMGDDLEEIEMEVPHLTNMFDQLKRSSEFKKLAHHLDEMFTQI